MKDGDDDYEVGLESHGRDSEQEDVVRLDPFEMSR